MTLKNVHNAGAKAQIAFFQQVCREAVGGITEKNAPFVRLALENLIIEAEGLCNIAPSPLSASKEPPKPAKKTPNPKKKKEAPKTYGQYGWIKLTDAERDKLVEYMGKQCADKVIGPSCLDAMPKQERNNSISQLGSLEFERCVAHIDELCEMSKNKYKWTSWYAVLQKCCRESWGPPAKGEQSQHVADSMSKMIWDKFMED